MIVGNDVDASRRLRLIFHARALFRERGYAATSFAAIATRAGVERMEVRHWWPSNAALALDCLLAAAPAEFRTRRGSSARSTVTSLANGLIRELEDREIRSLLRAVITARAEDANVATEFREKWIRPRRLRFTQVLTVGVERGELRPDCTPDAAADEILGVIYGPLLHSQQPARPPTIKSVIEALFTGVGQL